MARAALGDEELEAIPGRTGGAVTSCGIPGVIDARMTVATAMGEYTIVLRMLPSTIIDAERAGVPDAVLAACDASHGLILVGGPTGSGKSTSALSLVDHINATRALHLVMIEDPVLVRLTPKQALIQQREVGTDIPDTIAGIRWALRQDLDVLYLAELKTLDELDAVVTLADTGHLVIVVVHGHSPEDIIERLIDVNPAESREAFRKRFARQLLTVSAQTLLRRASGRGRVAAYGVLAPDAEMRRAIAAGADPMERQAPLPAGCQSLADDIRRLEREGVVSAETAVEALAAVS
jgi:twitching motility protein PilT